MSTPQDGELHSPPIISTEATEAIYMPLSDEPTNIHWLRKLGYTRIQKLKLCKPYLHKGYTLSYQYQYYASWSYLQKQTEV